MRARLALLGVLVGVMVGLPAQASAQTPQTEQGAQAERPVPGPDGTPLPPPDKAISLHWPAEVRRFVEGLVLVFGKFERPPIPLEEIETALGVTLTPQSFYWKYVEKSYAVSGSELLRLDPPRRLAEYRVGVLGRDNRRFHSFEFEIDAKKFCISPYELAIYTGNRYIPEMPIHGFRPPDRPWPSAYEWGMFARNSGGRFRAIQKPGVHIITSNRCVLQFRVSTFTTEE